LNELVFWEQIIPIGHTYQYWNHWYYGCGKTQFTKYWSTPLDMKIQ
jgi:hypothetical protein